MYTNVTATTPVTFFLHLNKFFGGNKKEKRAEDGTQTRDPQLGRLMLYQLSYFRNLGGQRWIRTTEGVSQQIYSLPHLATLVFAQLFLESD